MKNLNHCFSIADLKKLAKKSLPGVMFDYIEGGAEDEITIGRNRQVFSEYEFVPRVLRDVSTIDLTTTIQGAKSQMPIMCAPTAMSRTFHYQGEKAVALATEKAGIPYSLSTVATTSIEDVAKISKGTKFFQIYAWRNVDMVKNFILRCQQNHYQGVMLAVDLPTLGNRERDLKNGHGHARQHRLNILKGALRHPKWFYRFLTSPPLVLANMVEFLPYGGDAAKAMDTVNQQFDASVNWEDAAEIKKMWGGPFMLKGIQSVADAKLAVEMGASGIILSNHGGRQLDGAPPAFSLLADVKAEVGDALEIYIDGGIRRGSDVIKAIALGATACLIGRPYLYGLVAGGEAGVSRALEIFRTEMERVMKLIGCDSISKLSPEYVAKL